LTTGKTGFEIVPPLDAVAFIGFPTKKDDATVSHAGKVDQAVTVIFELNTQRLQFSCAKRKIYEQLRVALTARESATAVLGAAGGLLRGTLKRYEPSVRTLNLLHNRPHIRQKGVSFFDSK
jgi:hypothetical protein